MRFQELDTDASDIDGVSLGRRGFISDELRYTGYDLGSGKHNDYDRSYRREYDYEDEDEEDEDDEEGEWQVALKEKEDELVDRAMRRIKRARLKGDSEVDLSREEIDALERRKTSQQLVVRKGAQDQTKQPVVSKKPAAKKKGGGGFLGFGGPPPKPKNPRATTKQLPAPEERIPSGRNSPDLYNVDPRSLVPAGYPLSAGTRQPTSPKASRASSRPSSRTRQQPSPPSSYYGYDPRYYPSGDSSIRPMSSSSRNSDTRSLPDDPDWHPRSRSSSSAQLYQGGDVMQYETGRRNISGPPTVSYSSLRRAPPQTSRSGPISPDLDRRGSGLSNEVIEISSDEDEDESDEGVRVDTAPTPPGYASPRAPRARRGRR